MNRETAMRIIIEHVDQLKQTLDNGSNAERIKRTEARIDAMEFALEEMHRLKELEK